MAIRFGLNGSRIDTDLPPSTTVLDALREHFHLTGTKEGCAEGDCGACTIALGRPDGEGGVRWEAANSCLMLLAQIDGALVKTVEGLAGPDGLHRVQRVLAESDGTQCGFCTPGFVMSMYVLDRAAGAAGDGDIHEALAGNLCRCTGYRPIVEACRTLGAAGAACPEAANEAAELAALADGGGTAGEARHIRAFEAGGQRILQPRTLDALAKAKAADPGAVLLAGATDLGLNPSKRRVPLANAILTTCVTELSQVRLEGTVLVLGAGATYAQVLPALDAHVPAFGALVRRIGSRQIRAMGTLGGNLGTASPVGDTLPPLLALDADVVLSAWDGTRVSSRTLKVEDFIRGYRKTALAPGEFIREIRIPVPDEGETFHAYKLSRRFDQDISILLGAFRLRLEEGRVAALAVAFGGMADRPVRARHVEAHLLGRSWGEEALNGIEAALARDVSPLSDHRAGAAYRLEAAANLLRRLYFETAMPGLPVRLEAL